MDKTKSSDLAIKTVRDYVCAQCYGRLEYWPSKGGGFEIYCVKEREHAGFVTKHFADNERSNSLAEKREVDRMLIEVGVLPKPPKRSEAEILAELGF
jgi:hypothetical protein